MQGQGSCITTFLLRDPMIHSSVVATCQETLSKSLFFPSFYRHDGTEGKIGLLKPFQNRANPPYYAFYFYFVFQKAGSGCFANPTSEVHILIKKSGSRC